MHQRTIRKLLTERFVIAKILVLKKWGFRPFFVFAALVAGVFYLANKGSHMEKSAIPELKVAFPADRPSDSYEPARIYVAYEYIFLENTFSTLVEFSPTGELVPGIASSFGWRDDKLVFDIRTDLATADGKKITPRDVEISLKRLLIIGGNTHGNFHEIICRGQKITSIDQKCDGIYVSGDQVILQPGRRIPFLLPMLAALDFAIIPESSLNKDLKIVDFRNTSGPFFVEKDNGSGHITLKANKHHYHYHNAMPQEVHLVPLQNGLSIPAFQEDKVALLTTIDGANSGELYKLAKHAKHANVHQTMNIETITAVFTDAGRKKLSLEQRRAFGKILRENLRKENFHEVGMEEALQFFPDFGEGAVSKAELESIARSYNAADTANRDFLKGLKITFLGRGANFLRDATAKALPEAQVAHGKITPNFQDGDVFIVAGDSGFMEDINLVTYAINFGTFGPVEAGQHWLNQYMQTDSKSSRIAMLKKLHFEALESASTVPLFQSSYVAIAKKPWSLGLSKFYANNPFYFMRYEQN